MSEPAPFLAHEEELRGEALAARIEELNTEPGRWDVGAYQYAAQAAFATAAERTEQPR